jgi:competence protein ComEA
VESLGRSQILVVLVVALVVVGLGARALRADEAGGAGRPPEGAAAPATASGAGALSRGGSAATVHVAGAVRHAGVYRLRDGARVADAVRRAGGARHGAALDGVNLAARVADGQQIVVPGTNAAASAIAAGDDGATADAGAGGAAAPVSLGSASAEQLQQIEGIGPKTAGKILAYRTEHGGFSSVDELDRVDGIGPKTMATLREGLQP